MAKIAGFTLTKASQQLQPPPWMDKYPHVATKSFNRNGWAILLWGCGDLTQFISDNTIIVGYSDIDMATLDVYPLQNRGLIIRLDEHATITNDALGMMQVFYGSKDGVPWISTCEESVIRGLGRVTLGPGRLAGYLMLQSTSASLTLWSEIDKLYANSLLSISPDGNFRQSFQEPLNFTPVKKDYVTQMASVLRETVRHYTDPLDDVILMLSHGHDSRLILCNMLRPERVHARTFPLSHPARRAHDVVIAKESARLAGVTDHKIVDLERNQLRDCTRPATEFYGTPLGAVQIYLYDVCERVGRESPSWPIIAGLNGDEHAGIALFRSRNKLRQESDPADRFVSGCYSWVKSWLPRDLDAGLTFDWRGALKPIREIWTHIWQNTEGDDLTKHAHLIHTRNRGNQYITYAWQGCDLYGGLVGPIYNDRHYVEFMLSLPHEVLNEGTFDFEVPMAGTIREVRTGQVELFQRYFPEHYPYARLPLDAFDWANRLDPDALAKAKGAALWPLVPNGSKPSHGFFNAAKFKELYRKAVNGDMRSYYLLNSVQPLAWAIEKGYVQ